MLAITSCEHIDTQESKTETTQTVKNEKPIQFIMKGITEEYSTRATVKSVGCTDLWIWEDSTLLAHKTNTEEDFDTPTINLPYGSHDITFLASSSDEQTWNDGIWSTTHMVQCFATQMNITVSGNSSSNRQIQLNRRNSRIKFTTTDVIPNNITTCHLTVQNHKSMFDNLTGGTAYLHEATVDISSKQGSTYSIFVNTLTEHPTEEEDCNVMIEFLDNAENIVYHYERTIKIKSNRCTNLIGNFFSDTSNTIVINNDWDTQLDKQLFE